MDCEIENTVMMVYNYVHVYISSDLCAKPYGLLITVMQLFLIRKLNIYMHG